MAIAAEIGPAYTAAMATAGIILIGDELLSGKVVDENAQLLIGDLRDLGVALKRVAVIADDLDEIASFVRDFSQRFDHVFTSGGVGPTHDDLTMAGVARAFGTTVMRHPDLEQLLRSYYGERLEERNLRMADIPDGAHFVSGDSPSWPVIAYRNVYILPGIPEIFRRKWRSMAERFRTSPYHLRLIFTSAEEGSIAADLDRVVADHPGVQVGSYPKLDGDYRVKVTLESKDRAAVEAAFAALSSALGNKVVRIG
jgi:molybdenum cofactor synthesis domain-containing protein